MSTYAKYSALALPSSGGGGGVTSVSGTSTIISSGGATPAISIQLASGSQAGALSAADWTTFNAKGNGDVVGPASATNNAI